MTSWLHVFRRGHHTETLVKVNGREDHALALNTHYLTRLEVCHEEDALAYQYGGVVIESGNTTEDGTVGAGAVIDGKLQELLRLLHLLTSLDKSHTDVEFLKVLETDGILDRGKLW